jgi:hypothetical protein
MHTHGVSTREQIVNLQVRRLEIEQRVTRERRKGK